jgi:hypothetical protein
VQITENENRPETLFREIRRSAGLEVDTLGLKQGGKALALGNASQCREGFRISVERENVEAERGGCECMSSATASKVEDATEGRGGPEPLSLGEKERGGRADF